MSAPPREGLTGHDLASVTDESLRKALQKAFANQRISYEEVKDILRSTLDRDGFVVNAQAKILNDSEIRGLWMLADKSTSLDDRSRKLLLDFLTKAAGIETMYVPDQLDQGTSLPGSNFAGKGYRGTFRMRPYDLFELAAKFHDLAYQINGTAYGRDAPARENSRRAKADYVFHIMTAHEPPGRVHDGLGSRFYRWMARRVFQGTDRSEFVAGDGYINPLIYEPIYKRLADPNKYLMIPYSQLPRNMQPQGYGDQPYYRTCQYDYAPGIWPWFRRYYWGVLESLRISSATGPS